MSQVQFQFMLESINYRIETKNKVVTDENEQFKKDKEIKDALMRLDEMESSDKHVF